MKNTYTNFKPSWLLSLMLLIFSIACNDDEGSSLNPAFDVSTNTLDLGNITVKTTAIKSMSVTASDLTEDVIITVSGDAFSISDDQNGTFTNSLTIPAVDANTAGTVSVFVRFESETTGDITGSLKITSEIGEFTVTLSGTVETEKDPSLDVSSTTLDFEDIESGTSAIKFVTITAADLTENIVVTVTGNGFSIADTEDGSYGNSIAILASAINGAGTASVFVKFSSSSTGDFEGELTIISELDADKKVALSGSVFENAEASLEVSAEAVTFSAEPNTAATKFINISADNLTEDLTVTVSGNAFTISDAEDGTFGSDLALAAADLNGSAEATPVYIKFSPTDIGTFEETLTISSTELDPGKTVALNGTATAGTLYFVENFDYDADAITPAGTQEEWFALTDPDTEGWYHYANTISPMTLTEGLTFTGYPGSGIGKAFDLSGAAGGPGAFRDATVEDLSNPTKDFYYAAMVNLTSVTATGFGGPFANILADDGVGGVSWRTRFNVRVDGNDATKWQLSARKDLASAAVYSETSYNNGETYVVVYKQSPATGDVSLYVFNQADGIPATEPVVPDAISKEVVTEMTPIGFILRNWNNVGDGSKIDGLRIADSWATLFRNE
ncbi:choice-of-anchor D domain-containing protein [Fulvivirga sp. M361]|uniref:choice-of-anchor D domain-containing protein n=1 Tax=Fulvivirga sp. M361 TaxID=2594266 RepID=UPI00117AC37A|nr:choice-of-anchor D domain-containing protein [Fulvivirga sp. M361]TRX55522.1 choice-of-anchor D domain-containing protein [Fulvivirga sp. M361]